MESPILELLPMESWCKSRRSTGALLGWLRTKRDEEKGWKAYPYVWNDDDTDAYLSVAGAKKTVEWKNGNK